MKAVVVRLRNPIWNLGRNLKLGRVEGGKNRLFQGKKALGTLGERRRESSRKPTI